MAVLESGILNGTYRHVVHHHITNLPVVDGFILQVYDDGTGIPTVGLGHRVYPQDHLHIGDVITLDRAKEFFRLNREPAEMAINRDVHVPLHQYEYDALVSVIFNTGPNRRPRDPWPSTRSQYLADFLNHGEYGRMHDVIRGFIANIVAGRRQREARLFDTGVYDATH
ncbi:lysozyme [Paraburkholderia sp. J63]|uniref:lysozyme n=1 Tax=Paraburkholderia sp. J63 TaxID=2805434 RepID=UPI002ABDE502|nr:lysozyme [Paraburkholderia sp. J63]